MNDILYEIYCLVDESLPVARVDTRGETALRAALTAAQTALLEAYQDQHGAQEERERQLLFYRAVQLGITLAAGGSRRL